MDNDEKDLIKTDVEVSDNAETIPVVDQDKMAAIDALEEDIIRNDTIPETKDTPGSNGAFPVGAFDTSKD